MNILRTMLAALPAPRREISKFAPRLIQLKINPEMIGKLIGPGGKMIRAIQEETGAKIDIEDDGTNDLIVGRVVRGNEQQSWFVAEHLEHQRSNR